MATARDRMISASPPAVEVLDEVKAKRLGGKTMLMPSPLQVEEAIRAIQAGDTKSLRQIRMELAKASGAEITCPVAARSCWKLVAEAAEESRVLGEGSITPWWRVTKDGHAFARLPGGEQRHLELLRLEGVNL